MTVIANSIYNEPFGAHLISSQVATPGVGAMVFSFLNYTPLYASLIFDLVNFAPTAANASLIVKTSADGGATFQNIYYMQMVEMRDGYGPYYWASTLGYFDTFLPLLNQLAGRKLCGRFMFAARATGGSKQMLFHLTGVEPTYGVLRCVGGGTQFQTASVNALWFGFYGSNINSGAIRMYGLAA